MGEHEPKGDTSAQSGGTQGTSTASSGPAGAHFEGQVAAFYMLAMLSGAPARGLPGATISRVALQQANSGRPLDDVIVHAIDASGKPSVLEIQVKRTISFTASDSVFRKVVGQIVETSRRPDFWSTRVEMAIATSRGSRKIDGPYQDVLALARQIGDSATFVAQLKLAGVANDDMRGFVKTFQNHLRDEGASDDDESTWQILRRLQILKFDFAAPGSISEELARERVARMLHPDDTRYVDALWGNLVELAINVAKHGGDKSRSTLVESLTPLGFRLVGDRRHAKARASLAEDARLALADIQNQVGKVTLTRHERVKAVHEALDNGRYVEIRGDAGVGKSGVLRQVAESMQHEGNVVVLSPGRCVPRGWSALRTQLAFDGTLREFLVELANDGATVVFLDNLDSFNEEERRTVVDIVRESAQVKGISILATARPDFGVDDPSWLPSDALDRLGRVEPVVIDQLSEAEIEQLTTNDPALAPLLRDSHPARQVIRNLFRLARLASQPASAPFPRTEIDMAEQWWGAADCKKDAGWRDRSRLLLRMTRQALLCQDSLDVTAEPAAPIDTLVATGTLRNLGPDRVDFRHDVLREWAIANTLHAEVGLIDSLNLERPAPSTLYRAVELAARMAIERAADGAAWYALLERLSRGTAHRSWRRAALLALVHSEAAEAMVRRAQPVLFGDHAGLLRELIRTVMAVDVVPASKAFASVGIDPALIPAGLNIPRGPAWLALIMWLLSVGNTVPSKAIPEIVNLYTDFSVATFGTTAITPLTTRQVYAWLRQMEPRVAPGEPNEGFVSFEQFEREDIQSLRSDLRTSFVVFAHRTPDLAAEYLQAIAQNDHNSELARSILKMRGSLAQAAPAELAKLTEQVLIERPRPRDRGFGRDREEPFSFIDHEFLPASPAQGPFFELLVNAPEHGLALIHHLVSHAVSHASRGRDAGADVISLDLPDGVRTFPWTQTYFWSRDSHYYCITSALMALESWAHRRVEANEPFDAVLADVLGPPSSCTAYLLVAIDLILSHWPKSAESAVEFLGCPELLCLDRTRQVHDQIGNSGLFDFGSWRPEPRGAVSAAELKNRSSRRNTLDDFVGKYAVMASPEKLSKLLSLLKRAADRLGPADALANLGDPEFMVLYAQNLADLTNWRAVDVTLRDGSAVTALQYASPTAEQSHLQALRDAEAERSSDFSMQTTISVATDDPSRLSPEQRRAAVVWARRQPEEIVEPMEDLRDGSSRRMLDEAVLVSAMMVMRDGDDSIRAEHGEWALAKFNDVLRSGDDDPVHQVRSGLRFNPIAIAYVGLIHALQHGHTADLVKELLEVAASGRHAAAHGFGAAATVLMAIDERLPPALLRCAFRSCVVPNRVWDLSKEELMARAAQQKVAARATVAAEIEWLVGARPEPQWPAFPRERPRPRRHLRVGIQDTDKEATPETDESQAEDHTNHQGAALWLRQIQGLGNADVCPWLRDIAAAYMPWTVEANGGALNDGEDTDDATSQWNDAFFGLSARCIGGLKLEEVVEVLVKPITQLPDRNFFDALADFLRNADAVYFGDPGVQASVAVGIRSVLADRMLLSKGWQRLSGSRDLSIEMHIGPAIATLFFNDHHFVQSTKCYLLQKSIERVGPFLPVLDKLIQAGPSPFVALVLLNLLEVAPRAEYLDLLVQAGKTWLDAYPDFRSFWNDHGFGRRWCKIVEEIHTVDCTAIGFNATVNVEIERIVAELVGLGVSEATRLEELLSGW